MEVNKNQKIQIIITWRLKLEQTYLQFYASCIILPNLCAQAFGICANFSFLTFETVCLNVHDLYS